MRHTTLLILTLSIFFIVPISLVAESPKSLETAPRKKGQTLAGKWSATLVPDFGASFCRFCSGEIIDNESSQFPMNFNIKIKTRKVPGNLKRVKATIKFNSMIEGKGKARCRANGFIKGSQKVKRLSCTAKHKRRNFANEVNGATCVLARYTESVAVTLEDTRLISVDHRIDRRCVTNDDEADFAVLTNGFAQR